MGDGDEEQGGDVDGEDGAQQPSGKTLVIFGCPLLEDKNYCFLFELFENLFFLYIARVQNGPAICIKLSF